jgi:hypothetical protein
VGPLTGQWSTVNSDRAMTGLWRAGLGLDMGWVGPGRPGHMSSYGCVHMQPRFRLGFGPCGSGSQWTVRCGVVNRRLGPWWTEFTWPSPSWSMVLQVHGPVWQQHLSLPCFSTTLPCTPPSAWQSRAAPSVALFPLLAAHMSSLPRRTRYTSSPFIYCLRD